MNPQLSIVVPCLNFGPNLLRLLKSLELIANPLWEVLVVFNLADPDGEEIAQAHGARTLVVGKVGVNLARNLGLSNSRADIVLFLDDDCEITDEKLLFKHLDQHRLHPDVTGIGGLYEVPWLSSRPQKVYHRLAMEWVYRVREPNGFNLDLLGGHVSYKKSLLPKGLKFDPTIEFGGSETEFHLRIVRSGARLLLVPELSVVHHSLSGVLPLVRKGFCQGQTYAQLPLDLSHLASRGTSTRGRDRIEAFLESLYAYSFHLGSQTPMKAPKTWAAFAQFCLRDMATRFKNRLKAALNCRLLTNLHILLRLTLIPRGSQKRLS